MPELKPLPLSQEDLDQYRFAAQTKNRPSFVGGNVGRRRGQSLEFREFAPYQFGDDVRHIDWYASSRYSGQGKWLVRRFFAEEHFDLILSIDTRPTMTLPDPISKLQIASWLAEALTRVALPEEHCVVWHHLFGSGEVQKLGGSWELKRMPQVVRQFSNARTDHWRINLGAVERCLPPTAVWVIITDLYFDWDSQAQVLAQRIREAQDDLCWVVLLELDSWPSEKHQLGLGARELEGADYTPEPNKLWVNTTMLAEVDSRIKNHRAKFLEAVTPSGCDILHWQWPSDRSGRLDFVSQFGADENLQRLFMRDK